MTHNVHRAELAATVLSQLLLLSKLLAEDSARGLGALGLTEARAHVLWVLGATPGLTQRALAERLGVSARNITTLIDALEQTGFVARRTHASDRRAIALALTEKGAATYATLRTEMATFAAELFGDLPEPQLQQFETTLASVVVRLEVLIAAAGGKAKG